MKNIFKPVIQKSKITMLFIWLFLLLFQHIQSQNIVNDLKKINLKYLQTKRYELILNYQLFLDNQFDSKTSAEFMKDGSSYYYKIEDNELIKNKSMLVSVDHTDKIVVIRKNVKEEINKNSLMKIDFEEIVKNYEKVTRIVNGKNVQYQIDFKNSKYKSVILKYDSTTMFLTYIKIIFRVPVEVDEKTRKMAFIEINISTNLNNLVFKADQFSYTKFITVSGKTFKLNSPYSAYQLFVSEE